MAIQALLTIEDFSCECRLGCTVAEREFPQEVRASVEIAFAQTPKACLTDELKDTICYAEICESIRRTARSREFATVENLAQVVFETVKIPHPWRLTLHKVKPPVDGLLGGVKFRLGNIE